MSALYEGRDSVAVIPFPGTAVIDAFSGCWTRVTDPFERDCIARQPESPVAIFHQKLIDKTRAALQRCIAEGCWEHRMRAPAGLRTWAQP